MARKSARDMDVSAPSISFRVITVTTRKLALIGRGARPLRGNSGRVADAFLRQHDEPSDRRVQDLLMGGMPWAVAFTVLALSVGAAGCSRGETGADLLGSDRPTFTSVAALNRDADAAVLGTVDGVIGTELDNGGNPESDTAGGGTPVTLLRFSVERAIRGQAPGKITIAWPGSAAGVEDRVSALRTGQRVVLWLDHLNAEQAPGLDLVDDVWVSVGGDDAVMDVEGQVVKARSSHLVSLDTEPGDSPLETTLAALEQSP